MRDTASGGGPLDPQPLYRRDLRVDFIDPLFAVVLGLGIEYSLVNRSGPPALFDSLVLTLGFCNIVLSWFGYHESIARKPIRGGGRFILDVLILFVYLYIVLHYTSWYLVAAAFAILFFVFCVWDYLKSIERAETGDLETPSVGKQRLRVTAAYFLVALFVAGLSGAAELHAFESARTTIRSVALLGGYVVVFGFRFSKAAMAQGSAAWQVWSGVARFIRGAPQSTPQQ